MPETDDATIVYDDADGETLELTVPNDRLAYFQDHWLVRTSDDAGRAVLKRIPRHKVHHVERPVGALDPGVGGLREQVESLTEELREALTGRDTRETRDRRGGHDIDVRAESDE